MQNIFSFTIFIIVFYILYFFIHFFYIYDFFKHFFTIIIHCIDEMYMIKGDTWSCIFKYKMPLNELRTEMGRLKITYMHIIVDFKKKIQLHE